MKQALHGDAQEIPGGQSGVCSAALSARILPGRIHDHTVKALLWAVCSQGKMVKVCASGHHLQHRDFAETGRSAPSRVSMYRDRSREPGRADLRAKASGG